MSGEHEAYCMKCKTKAIMVDAEKKVSANGRSMMSGKCPKCATKMNKFVASAIKK